MAVLFGAGQNVKASAAPSERAVLALLLWATAALSLAGISAAHIKFNVMGGRSTPLTSAFIMAYEGNVPTLFSYTLLNVCCALLLLIAAKEWDRHSRWCHHWLGLGIVFFLLAFDEAASVHEKLVPMVQAYGARGLLHFAWVVPAGIFVAVMAALYMRWLAALPKDTRWLMVLSAALYVGGALLVEMPEGAYAEVYGQNTFLFHLLTVVEETFEMMGLSVFSYALLRHAGYLKGHPTD
jgi:hypothetical protein